MKWSQFALVGRRVRNSLWELLWSHLLTALTMAMALFVFGAFMLLQENLEAMLGSWGDQLQINAYVDNGLSAEDTLALRESIGKYPEVARVRLISQQQAWRDFQAALGAQSNVLDGLPRDVLPASFEIAVKPSFRDRPWVDAVAARLKKEKGITSVEYPQDWLDRVNLIILAVQWMKWIFGGVLFLTTYFIVGSTVKLAILARRDEIEIMQLVGAPEELIQGPFVLEGMLQGALGGTLAVGGLALAFRLLRDQLPVSALAVFGVAHSLRFLDPRSIAFIVVIGLILGAAGSLFSLRRFMRRWKA